MKRRSRRKSPGDSSDNDSLRGDPESSMTPLQQDEEEVLDEVGAERDEETGDMVLDEDRAREVGALDADTIRENRRLDEVVGKRRANKKNVPFNTNDPLLIYEELMRLWPANSIDIFVKRLTGAPVQTTIVSRPRSASELYAALMAFHGVCDEAEYEVSFLDTGTKRWRSRGRRITLPNTRPAAQQGQPMQPLQYGYPPGYPAPPPQGYAPPGYPPPGYPPQGYPQPQGPQAPAAAAPGTPPAPVVVHAPPAPGVGEMLETMRQMYQFAVSMAPPPAPAPAPTFAPPAPVAHMPLPPPPASTDPNVMLAYMRTLSEIVQQLVAARSAPVQTPAPQAYAPPQATQPPRPGYIWIEQLQTYVPLASLARAISEPQSRGPVPGAPEGGYPARGGPPRGPYREREGGGGPTYPGYQNQPPPRERSVVEQFRDSISVVRTVANMAQEANEILGGGGEPSAPAAEAAPEDDGPIRVMKFGDSNLAFDRESGAFKVLASLMMNGDRIMKAANEHIIQPLQQRQAPPQQRLPPGHVVMGPGYRPPPGMVAIPVDQLPPGLPDIPPPISESEPEPEPAPAQSQQWSAPVAIEGVG